MADPSIQRPPIAIGELVLEHGSNTLPIDARDVREADVPYLRKARAAEKGPLDLDRFEKRGASAGSPGEDRSASDSPWDEPGGGAVTLRIEDVRSSALTGNLDLQVNMIQPSVAQSRYADEIGRFETTFSAAMSHRRTDAPLDSIRNGSPPDTIAQALEPAVNFPLYTGGTMSFQESLYRTNARTPGGDAIYDAAYGVRLSQPLLRGAGAFVNTAPIRIAELGIVASEAVAKFNATLILAEADRAYWRLYEAREVHRIASDQLELAASQLGVAKRLAESGILAEVETLRAESGLQLRADAYLATETDVRLRRRELKRIMLREDLPFDGSADVALETPPRIVNLELDRRQLVEEALRNRADLLGLQVERAVADLQLGVARNGLLPRLQFDFVAKYLGAGLSAGAANNEVSDGHHADAFAGLSTEFPIWSQLSARSRIRLAELQLRSVGLSSARLQIAISQQVLDAADRYEQSWQRILAAQRAVAATRKTYEAELRLFELAQRTGDLVLDAAERLGNAQIHEVQASIAYEIAKVDLAEATGTLLGYGNVVWESVPTPAPTPADPIGGSSEPSPSRSD